MQWAATACLLAACQGPDLPTDSVSFRHHVVPILKRDCAACHEQGEYRVKIRGDHTDYGRLVPFFVHLTSPASSRLLLYAAGEANHPRLWPEDCREYATVLAWIAEGALEFPASNIGLEDVDTVGDLDAPADLADTNDSGEEDVTIEEVVPEITVPAVSFANDLSPLHKKDCSMCHGAGQFGVTIKGLPVDYPVVMKYVDQGNPGNSEWLKWAEGAYRHPLIWSTGSSPHQLFLQWVTEGATDN
jgi:cytochrome c5